MPPDATMQVEDPAPPRGSVASFRLLTARLKREPAARHPAPPPASPSDPPPAAAIGSGSAEAAVRDELPPRPPPPPPPSPGEAVAALIDIIWGAVDLPPQERSMAGDVLLLLLPRLAAGELAMLAERLAAMDAPPPLLVSRLLRDPRPEVGGVVLERTAHLNPDELLAACREATPERLRLVARRRSVPAVVSDHLVRQGDLLSLLALLRNPGAELSFASFLQLSQLVAEHPGLQAPLALRADLPLAVALDLLWRLPPELRRVIMARFLSDSATLSRILSIALASGEAGVGGEEDAPSAEAVDEALGPLFAGRRELAMERLARLADLAPATVERIFSDDEGEALVVLLKALGLGRSRCDTVLDRIRTATGLLREDRPQEELKAVFDALSFTKARVLLLYWDWFTRRAGPYSADAQSPGSGPC